MQQKDLSRYLEFAKETAYSAGKLTLGYFQTGINIDYKSDDTPVTIADRYAETLICDCIKKKFPHHAVVGEEFGASGAQESEYRWFVDPIDGTKAFMCGVPTYAVLLGLEINGRIDVGVAYFPALNEMVYAASGLGCRLNGRMLRVSQTDQLNRAVLAFTDVKTFADFKRSREWEALQQAVYYRAGWSDAYGHALVASGRVELMLDPVMNPWDCGPFPVILREAGGYFGDWQGNETIHAGEALSTSTLLLPQVMAIINKKNQQGF